MHRLLVVSSHWGDPKRIAVASSYATAVAVFFYPLASTPRAVALCVGVCTLGVPARMALRADYVPEDQQHRVSGQIVAAERTALIVGPLLASLIVTQLGYRYVFYAEAMLSALASIPLVFGARVVRSEPAAAPFSWRELRRSYRDAGSLVVADRFVAEYSLSAVVYAFPVVTREPAERLLRAFERLRERAAWQAKDWSSETAPGHLLAECLLPSGRRQPLDLRLTSVEGRPAVRVVSPVGRVDEPRWQALLDGGFGALDPRVRLGLVAVHRRAAASFTLTAEALVLVRQDDLVQRLGPVVERVLLVADVVEERLLAVDASLTAFTPDLLAEVSRA